MMESDEQPLDRHLPVRRLLAWDRQPVPFDLVVLTPDELEERLGLGEPFISGILARGRTLNAA